MSPPLTITVQTFSDTLCPWCYIGKKNLDRAMETYKAEHPDVQFELTWNPFYLNSKAKVSAYEKRDYFLAKFGPVCAPGLFVRIEREATALGLTVKWEGRCGNTRDSHILLLLAARQRRRCSPTPVDNEDDGNYKDNNKNDNGNENDTTTLLQDLSDAFFKGTFEQGKDISDRSFLVETAVRLGLGDGGKSLLGWLDSEEACAEADALDRYAKQKVGITAVPSYVVQGRYRVGGKQDPEVFLQLFERIRLERVGVK